MDIKLNSIEQFVEYALALRRRAEEAEATFLLFLRGFELERADLWKTGGVETYDAFLQSHQIVNVARYRNFLAGYMKLGDVAEAAGVNATIAAAGLKNPSPDNVKKIGDWSRDFTEMQGVHPSEQTAKEWVKDLNAQEPATTRGISELRRLRAENQQLRAENARLKKRIAQLERKKAA